MKGLDLSSRMPEEMQQYIENYGFHFSKKALDYAIKGLKKELKNVEPLTKEQVNDVFKKYGITIKNDTLYDATYKFIKEKAVHYGKSLSNEQILSMHVQEDLDEEGATGEETFREWIADCIGSGHPIDWYSLL